LFALSNKERQLCDEFPTINECENAIKQMKNNKSPGTDGLPVEFYKIFWNDIKAIYYDSLKQTFEKNEMPYSLRLSILYLIHKKGERNDLFVCLFVLSRTSNFSAIWRLSPLPVTGLQI
jgi:hypothetical protein